MIKMERKTLRNILFILFLLLILLTGVRYGYDFIQNRRSSRDDVVKAVPPGTMTGKTEEAAQAEPVATETPEPPSSPVLAEAEPEVMSSERYVTGEHRVKKDESFSLITGFYWDDIFLWPDLYIRNSMRSNDPDLIYPDEIITIYNRLGKGMNFTTRETGEILEAYLEVYRIYKKLGSSKNNSVWSLLWCAARYDHNFLETYKDRIDPEDRAMAQKYIDEQGFLD